MRSVRDVYGVTPGEGPAASASGTAGSRRVERLPWDAVLDALEERTRRFAAVIDGDDEADLPDATPLPADGPLPPHLELRARVLLAETSRLAELAEKRRDAVKRTLHYNQA